MTSKEKEVILNVLEMYRDMPYLWQKSHKDYFNKELRSEGLKVLLEVYKNFDDKATITTFKKKLLNMRSNYNKELSKVIASKTTGAGAEEVYVPTLWYFDAFDFLGSTSEPCRNTSDTLTCSLESEKPLLGLSSDEENDPQREQTASTYRHQPKKRRETLLTKQEKLLESAKNLFSNKENEWEVFGKSVGLQMKDLNKKQLTIAQKIISDVIFLAKLDRLSEDSYVVTTGHNYPPDMNRRQYSSVQSPASNYSDQSPHHSSPSPHSNSLPPHYNRPSSASEYFPSLSPQNHLSLPSQNQTSSYGSQSHRYQAPFEHQLTEGPNDNVETQYQPSPSTYVHVEAPHPQSYHRQPIQLPKHSVQTQQLAIPVHSTPQHAIQTPQNTIQLQPKVIQSPHHSMHSANHSIQSPHHSIHSPEHSIQSPQNTSQSQPIAIQSPHHSMQSAHHSIQSPQHSVQLPQNTIQSPHHSIQSPDQSIQSPQDLVQSQQHAVQSPCHSFTSSSQTITVCKAEDFLKYIDTDLGPTENFTPTITEGPANADVWKEFLITKPKKNKPKKK